MLWADIFHGNGNTGSLLLGSPSTSPGSLWHANSPGSHRSVCVELKLLLSPARSLACKIYCLQNTCWWITGDFTAESQKSIRKCKLVSSPHHKCQLCVCLCVNVWEEREFSTFPFQCALHFWARVKNVLKVWSGAFHCDPSSHQTLV